MHSLSRNSSKGKGRRPSSDSATVPYYGEHDPYRDGGRDRELFRPGWSSFIRAEELAGAKLSGALSDRDDS